MAAHRSARILSGVVREAQANPPRVLAATRRKQGKRAAESQRRAILLSKARAKGARI